MRGRWRPDACGSVAAACRPGRAALQGWACRELSVACTGKVTACSDWVAACGKLVVACGELVVACGWLTVACSVQGLGRHVRVEGEAGMQEPALADVGPRRRRSA